MYTNYNSKEKKSKKSCKLRGCRSGGRTPTDRRPHFNIIKSVGTLPTLIIINFQSRRAIRAKRGW